MSESYKSYGIRRDVLLRNSFRCVLDCDELAGDIHHVEPRARGGTDERANLLGLCDYHHKWVHKYEGVLCERHPDTGKLITRLDLAKYYLAKQIEKPGVRVSEIHRIELFQEVEKSTATPEDFWNQWHPVYNRNYWSAYDVFLKAAWNHLREHGANCSPVGAMILYRRLWLYRRRSGKFGAARSMEKRLTTLLNDLRDPSIEWLRGKVEYELAYMDFMQTPFNPSVWRRFECSAYLEKKVGNKSGELVSHATALMVRMQAEKTPLFDDFLKVLDSLSEQSDPLANRWCKYNLPYLMAIGEVISGGERAMEKLVSMLPDAMGHLTAEDEMEALAKEVAGYHLWQQGEVERCVQMYESARTIKNRIGQAEGRSGVTVALGDAYACQGRWDDARRMWELAKGEAPEFLNRRSQQVALSRLKEENSPRRKFDKMHFLFDPST